MGKGANINKIKKAAEENYHIAIDHCIIFEPSGLARIIDLLAPNGIKLNSGNEDRKQLIANNHILKGNELVSLIEQDNANPHNQDELKVVFSALKKEIAKNQSPEKLVSLAPTIIHEFYNSVDTDLDKGQLMTLGLTVLLNPITAIEPIQLVGERGNNQAVYSPLVRENPPVFN